MTAERKTWLNRETTDKVVAKDVLQTGWLASDGVIDYFDNGGQKIKKCYDDDGEIAYVNDEKIMESTPRKTNLIAWYDANSSKYRTEVGGVVSQVDDKSGNGFHLIQNSGSEQPTISSLNGLDVLDFDGNDSLSASNMIIPSSGNVMVSWIANQRSASTFGGFIGMMAGSNFWYHRSANSSVSFHIITTNGIGANGSLFTGVNMNQYVIYTLTFDYTGTTTYFGTSNGGNIISPQTYVSPLSTNITFNIGKGNNITPVSCVIPEVVICEDVSEITRQRLEGYLAHKWSLTDNLPIEHPYKIIPPQ